MHRAWKSLRYSSIGVAFVGIISFLQGCTQDDTNLALILALLLGLFAPHPVTLTVEGINNNRSSGSGTVSDTEGVIDCFVTSAFIGPSTATGDCSETVPFGTVIELNAVPNDDFDGWLDCDEPSGTTCTMTMDEDKTVFADFGD